MELTLLIGISLMIILIVWTKALQEEVTKTTGKRFPPVPPGELNIAATGIGLVTAWFVEGGGIEILLVGIGLLIISFRLYKDMFDAIPDPDLHRAEDKAGYKDKQGNFISNEEINKLENGE